HGRRGRRARGRVGPAAEPAPARRVHDLHEEARLMAFDLHVDAARWRGHLDAVPAQTPGLAPLVKGNGYGLGRDVLLAEATRMGLDTVAVGTYAEVPGALEHFGGDVLVLSPWRPFLTEAVLHERVVHTIGRVEDVATLAATAPGARVVVEGET